MRSIKSTFLILGIILFIPGLLWSTILFEAYPSKIDGLLNLYKDTANKEILNEMYSTLVTYKNLKIQNILIPCLADSNQRQITNILKRYNYLQYNAFKRTQYVRDSLSYYMADADSFKNYSIRKFPEYAYFLAAQHIVTIDDLRQNGLKEKQALLDFMFADENLWVFVITKDSSHVESLPIAKRELTDIIRTFIEPLYGIKDPKKLSFCSDLAYQLYLKLIEPVERHLQSIQSIIIIPDDILFGVPFECFTTSMNGADKHRNSMLYGEFRNTRFLIEKYAIAYNFSPALMVENYPTSLSHKKLGRKIVIMSQPIGFAPTADTTLNRVVIAPPHGHDEAHRISRLMWRHDNIMGDKTTISFFKEHGFDYRWIHLALPGKLHIGNPCLSAVSFSSRPDSATESELTIAQIIDTKLKADLITLSGCQVVPAISENRERILGLPQALLAAGAHSVLFGLWQIHDITVSQFMAKFYWELKYKRQTNMLALQEAKLSALKDSFLYENQEISRAHPYFWASYMLIGNGNIRPPTYSTVHPYVVILIIYIVVLSASLIIVRKTIGR